MRGWLTCLGSLLLLPSVASCVVSERCFRSLDCKPGETCSADGRCVVAQLDVGLRPDSEPPIRCAPDMVKIAEAFCIDVYEASRVDATASSAGSDGSRATSRQGVLPWQVQSNAEAEQACQAAGKRLCTPSEWQMACMGPDGTTYAYGESYQPERCNGSDTFAGGQFHLTPTGSFPGCTNDWGVFDLNGNVWEHVAGGDATTVRGGAFNCSDSMTFHRCDYIPSTWSPTARGFRCCASRPTPAGG